VSGLLAEWPVLSALQRQGRGVRRPGYPFQPGDLIEIGVETGDRGDSTLAASQRDKGIVEVQLAPRGTDEVKRLGVEIGDIG
jgi:hypothetical protein